MSDGERILVVDDEVGTRESLQVMLGSRYRIITATNGPEVLQAVRETPPDLVLLDVKMPGMDGIEVLQRIKQMDGDIEAIMMTAFGSLDTARDAMAHGASEYLVKPFSEDEVESAVERVLARRAQRAAQLGVLREQALQSEKLIALGEMAAGIAHNFRNVLTTILGRAQLLAQNPANLEAVQRGLSIIEKAAEDGAAMVQRVQTFARGSPEGRLLPTDLNQVVQEAIEATQPFWKDQARREGNRIDVVLDLGTIPSVRGRAAELREVLTNMILNAIEAMPEGGRVTLRTRIRAGVVCVDVSDTGSGMTDEVKRRIFNPFFTTKGAQGTGLGLSVSYALIKGHNGDIEVQSELGRGTTFSILLPPAPP